MSKTDPYSKPSTTFRNKLGRVAWASAYYTLFRPSLRTMHGWRAFLLRCFGAKLGKGCRIYRRAVIWAPWNLTCEDHVIVADEAIIYNPVLVYLASHAVISQQAYLCAASHDYNTREFKMICKPIKIERYAWVAARANVSMGVTLAEGSVLGLASLTTKDLEPWSVYAGVPSQKVNTRINFL